MISNVTSIPQLLSLLCFCLAIVALMVFVVFYKKLRETETFKEIVKYYGLVFIPLAISVLLFIGFAMFDLKNKTGNKVIYYEGHRYEYIKDVQPRDTIIVNDKAWALKDHLRK